MRQLWTGLRTRMALLAALAVLPAIVVMAYDQANDRRRAHDRMIEESVRITRFAATEQASIFIGAHDFLQTLARLPCVQERGPHGCDDLLASGVRDHPGYLTLLVISVDGTILSASSPTFVSAPVSERPWFTRALRERTTVLGEYQVGRIGRPAVVVAHPMLGPTGAPQRVLGVAISLGQLDQLASHVQLPERATLTLFDRDGTILARYPDGQRWIGQRTPGATAGARVLAAAREYVVESTASDGSPRLGVTVPVETGFDSGLFVGVVIEPSVIFAELNHLSREHLALVGLVSLVAIATALIGGRLLVELPVETLAVVTKRIAEGDFSARAQLTGGAPGLTELADSVNAMAVALEARQQDRSALEDQLRQAQKMEAVGQLAGGIAHDFNNMLTAILGNAELVLDDLAADDPRRHGVEEIHRAASRAADLTHQLLAFSRKQILAPRVLHLGEVIRDVTPMLRRLIGETIDLKATSTDRGRVRADPGQIEQVLMNLAVNAKDAMADGGRLTIETSDVYLDEVYTRRHPIVKPGPYTLLAVSDTGHGMDAETQKRIFEPFFTTKPKGKGTGLGLATVYGIVKQSDGFIWVYSEPGHGTTFKIYLPLTTDAAESTEAAAPPAPAAATGRETIMLVEDEAVVREFVSTVLTRVGYTVHAAPDPKRAIELAGTTSGPIDMVVTDVVLPDMSGRALVAELQRTHPESAVLYMSGYTDNAIVHHGVLEPDMAFLQKPFSGDALVILVRDLLDARHAGQAVGGQI